MKEVRLFIYFTIAGLVELFSELVKLVSALVLRVVISVPVLVLLFGAVYYKLLVVLGASSAPIVLVFVALLVWWIFVVITFNPLPPNFELKQRLAVLKNKYDTAE